MSDLLTTVREAIRAHQMLAPGEAAAVAVSGGCDSMVLLDLLDRLSKRSGWRLTVAHFNHRLRGRASEADQRFVRAAAQQRGLHVVTGQGEVRSRAQEQNVSIEMAARELRHAFLARCAREAGATKILLAHHADDQVETFLLRLARGSSAGALAGMKWVAPSPADPGVILLRPLLATTREDLRNYAEKHRIAFREDATNASLGPRRNRIRRRLLPWLQRQVHPCIVSTIRRIMTLVGDDAEVVDALAREWLARAARQPFETLAAAVQRQVLALQLRWVGIEPTFERIERLRVHVDQAVSVGRPLDRVAATPGDDRPGQAPLTRPRAHRGTLSRLTGEGRGEGRFTGRLRQILRGADGLLSVLEPDETRTVSTATATWMVTEAPGAGELDGVRFRWRVRAGGLRGRTRVAPTVGLERFDADQVGDRITLRHWKPGDRFQPLGLGRAAKLQDLFVNAKVPVRERDRRLLGLTGGGEIFWVEGLRIGERFKLTVLTRNLLEWRWRRQKGVGSEVAAEKPTC